MRPASANSIECSVAAWCKAVWCCSAAIPASASPPCCCKRSACCRRGCKALYVSGEESAQQVALRARRLGLRSEDLKVLAEIQLENILATLASEVPDVVVIDSIQTVYSEALQSAPGSVAQVRECAAQLTRAAKLSGASLILVGPRYQRGRYRRPARAGAHGRQRAVFRRRYPFEFPLDPCDQESISARLTSWACSR